MVSCYFFDVEKNYEDATALGALEFSLYHITTKRIRYQRTFLLRRQELPSVETWATSDMYMTPSLTRPTAPAVALEVHLLSCAAVHQVL